MVYYGLLYYKGRRVNNILIQIEFILENNKLYVISYYLIMKYILTVISLCNYHHAKV